MRLLLTRCWSVCPSPFTWQRKDTAHSIFCCLPLGLRAKPHCLLIGQSERNVDTALPAVAFKTLPVEIQEWKKNAAVHQVETSTICACDKHIYSLLEERNNKKSVDFYFWWWTWHHRLFCSLYVCNKILMGFKLVREGWINLWLCFRMI